MHLIMKDLLKSYNSLNESLRKTFDLIEGKWIRVLEDNNVRPITCYIYEQGRDPRDLQLEFYLSTRDELTPEELEIIKKEACCKLTYHDEEISLLDANTIGKAERYIYIFTPLKITSSPIEDSWLKD